MTAINLTNSERRMVRELAGESWTARPVAVVEGYVAPRLAGRSYYWTTLSGRTIVRHPNAYGWPTLYHASTRRVEVGADWIVAQRGELRRNPDLDAAIAA